MLRQCAWVFLSLLLSILRLLQANNNSSVHKIIKKYWIPLFDYFVVEFILLLCFNALLSDPWQLLGNVALWHIELKKIMSSSLGAFSTHWKSAKQCLIMFLSSALGDLQPMNMEFSFILSKVLFSFKIRYHETMTVLKLTCILENNFSSFEDTCQMFHLWLTNLPLHWSYQLIKVHFLSISSS